MYLKSFEKYSGIANISQNKSYPTNDTAGFLSLISSNPYPHHEFWSFALLWLEWPLTNTVATSQPKNTASPPLSLLRVTLPDPDP